MCHYGCGFPATMSEPGKPWKAHKVCADRAAGVPEPQVTPIDVDESSGARSEPRPIGCAQRPDPGGSWCAGTGSRLSCQICPRSPTYWRDRLTPQQRASLPDAPSDMRRKRDIG